MHQTASSDIQIKDLKSEIEDDLSYLMGGDDEDNQILGQEEQEMTME